MLAAGYGWLLVANKYKYSTRNIMQNNDEDDDEHRKEGCEHEKKMQQQWCENRVMAICVDQRISERIFHDSI